MSVLLYRCARCATQCFPARLLCLTCGLDDFERFAVENVTVSEVTSSTRAGVSIATVTTDGDVRLVARVPTGTTPGTRLRATSAAAGPGLAFVPDPVPDVHTRALRAGPSRQPHREVRS